MSKPKDESNQKSPKAKGDDPKAEEYPIKGYLDKLFGGITFTWPKLILYAIGAAVLTSIFLIVPIFKDTSFVIKDGDKE